MKLKIAGLLLIILGLSILSSSRVMAVGRLAPDPADFEKSSEVFLEVSRSGPPGTNGLNSLQVVVIVYMTSTSGTINIINGADGCSGADSTTYLAATRFQMSRGQAPGASPVFFDQPDSSFTCGTVGVGATNSSGVTIGTTTYYPITVIVTHVGGGGGLNGFKIQAPAGGVASYFGGGAHFTVQDRVDSGSDDPSAFTFRFAPPCTLSGTQLVNLNWKDDDHWGIGGDWNQDNAYSRVPRADEYTMEVIERNRSTNAITARWKMGWNTGSSGGPIAGRGNYQILTNTGWSTAPVLSDPYGWIGSDTTNGGNSAFVRIPVRADRKYEWVWDNVFEHNGVHFSLPYNDILYNVACGSWDYNPRMTGSNPGANASVYQNDVITITGDAENVGQITGPNNTLNIYAPVGGGSVAALTATSWAQGAIGAGGNSNPNRSAQFRVNMNAPPGSQVCFRVRVNPNTEASPGWHETGNRCFNILALPTWNYQPLTPTGSPADSANGPKPGTTIAVTGRVDNTGNGTGPNYRHQIQVQRSGGNWANLYNAIVPGMTAAAAPTARTVNYTIPANATHNEQFCFRTVANNGNQGFGVQGRVRPPSTFVNTIANGPRESAPLCYSVYNLRFDLDLGISMPLTAFPNQTISINYSACNQTDDELNLMPPASRGGAPGVTLTTSGNLRPSLSGASNQTIANGGCLQVNGSVTIPSTAVVGDRLCTTLNSSRNYGFSDGTGLGGTPLSLQDCLTVANQAYLKVYGNDSWAGFQFSNNTTCSSSGGRVRSVTRSVRAGSSDEYGVFAMGNIDGFGSANSPLSHLMKFANTPTHGSFGANRCVADYYELLSPQADPPSPALNGLLNGNSPGDGQYIYNSGQTLSGNVPNYDGRQTILINGDLRINQNIRYIGSYGRDVIPILVFVVRGNLLIDPRVQQLDGIYIVQGVIDTCAVDNTIGDFDPLAGPANGRGECDDKLEVNGSFIAQDIHFRRTSGGANEADTGNNVGQRCRQDVLESGANGERCAAEVFRFSPEAYLARPFFETGQDNNALPILQLRDLPPVF